MDILFIITFFLLIIYISLLLYYRAGWKAIPLFSSESICNRKQATGSKQYVSPPQTSNLQLPIKPEPTTFLTVIIPARNEENNLPALLKSLSVQTYPSHLFEVIVVDDFSTDNTAQIVQTFNKVRLIRLKDFVSSPINSYKKKAIEIAVEQSKGDLIVTTDADCIVLPEWLQTIAEFYEQTNAAFIAAPVAYLPPLKNEGFFKQFLKIFQLLDFTTLQGITGASVHKKFHSMCNGANLAYPKKIFNEVNGFAGIDNIASGDDMLLMNKISNQYKRKIFYLKSPKAIVHTQAMDNVKDFFRQRIRWAGKYDSYTDKKIKVVLAIVYFFNVLLFIIPIIGLFTIHYSIFNIQYSTIQFWLLLLILKTIAELFFLFPVTKFFGQTKWLWIFPLLQPFHILYTVIAGWLGIFGTYQWKGRNVK